MTPVTVEHEPESAENPRIDLGYGIHGLVHHYAELYHGFGNRLLDLNGLLPAHGHAPSPSEKDTVGPGEDATRGHMTGSVDGMHGTPVTQQRPLHTIKPVV